MYRHNSSEADLISASVILRIVDLDTIICCLLFSFCGSLSISIIDSYCGTFAFYLVIDHTNIYFMLKLSNMQKIFRFLSFLIKISKKNVSALRELGFLFTLIFLCV